MDRLEIKLKSAKQEHQKLLQDNSQLASEVIRLKKVVDERNKKFADLEETVNELREEVDILSEIKNELNDQVCVCICVCVCVCVDLEGQTVAVCRTPGKTLIVHIYTDV